MSARQHRTGRGAGRGLRTLGLFSTLSAALLFSLACDGDKELPVAAEAGANAEGAATPAAEDPAAIEAWMRLDTREFPLLIWAAQAVQIDYHAPERFDVTRQIQAAGDALARELPDFFASFEAKGDGGVLKVRLGEDSKEFEVAGGLQLREGAALLEQVLVYVRDHKKPPIDELHALEYAALNGYLSPLDPHTILLTPEEHADLGVKTKGRFGGVGIRVFEGERRIIVDEVLTDSPAAKAGMKDGDVILKIDGQATVNMNILEARELLRGPEGTVVKVLVRRATPASDKPGAKFVNKQVKLEVTRGVIQIQSVEATRLPDNVAYLRVSTFQADTGAKVGEALASMHAKTPLAGVVFDLRGNSGGLLTQATALLDHITTKGELVIVRSAGGRESQSAEPSTQIGLEVPVVALIDENSASAAEIVAGGISALERGVVVGRASFGKGTVQMLKPSQPYGEELALKLTVAEYRVAGDTKIQGRGVQPDLRFMPARLQEIPGVVSLFDEERFERARERSITSQLPSARHEEAAQTGLAKGLTLRYLTRSWELKEGEPPPMRDAEIRLAHELAVGLVGADDRAAALTKLKALHATMNAREDGAIAEGMTAFWGDPTRWGPSEGAAAASTVEVRAQLTEASKKKGPAKAGDVFEVELSVTNPGDTTLERVHVISDCGQDELDGIEYVFGQLGPGETKRQTLNLVMMAWHSDLHDVLHFDAHAGEPREASLGSAELAFDVAGAKRPHLGMDVWIIDDPKAKGAPKRPKADPRFGEDSFEIKGNGDGRVQPGEQVLLAFRVHNNGEGDSASTFVRVRNLSGKLALLEEGEAHLGRIAPGKTASGAIGVSVHEAADPKALLELNLLAADQVLRARVDEAFKIPLADLQGPWQPKPAKAADATTVGPQISFEGLGTLSATGTLQLKGRASHPRQVQDLVIWVQSGGGPLSDKKVAYVRQSGAGEAAGQLNFDQLLSLAPGPNRIRVIARDGDGVEGWSDAWVFVPKSQGAGK